MFLAICLHRPSCSHCEERFSECPCNQVRVPLLNSCISVYWPCVHSSSVFAKQRICFVSAGFHCCPVAYCFSPLPPLAPLFVAVGGEVAIVAASLQGSDMGFPRRNVEPMEGHLYELGPLPFVHRIK